MSRPRLLTDPEEIAASDAFRAALQSCGKTQNAVAEEIGDGVSQGTVWQWANRRLAIPAARAVDAARAVGADPASISVAWRQAVGQHQGQRVSDSSATPYLVSRAGISIATVRDAMLVLRAYLEDKGLPLSLAVTDPWLVKIALDVVSDSREQLDLTNVIAFKKRFTDRVMEERHADEGERAAEAG